MHRPESVPSILQENSVVLGYLLGEIRQKGDFEACQPPISAGGVDPGQVGVLGVNGTSDNVRVDGFELFNPITERYYLRRTYKRTAKKKEREREGSILS